MSKQKQLEQRQYWRVIVMACAAFIFNTTEFIPVALLSDIAQSFQMEVSHTGLMITVYAWVVSLMSLPFMLLSANLERKGLLIKLFIVFILSHILSVFAWNFQILLISRIGIALAHAVFWSITASLVMRVAPKNKKTQALGLLTIGTSLATVLGLPLGRIIGQAFGWRITFGLIACGALVVVLLLWYLLPRLPSKNAGSLKSLPLLAKRPLVLSLYLVTMIIVSAHFTAYSYIEPFMVTIGHFTANSATAILLIFGLSGIITGLLFNRLYRLSPAKFLAGAMSLLTLSLLALLALSQHVVSMFSLAFIWGIGIAAVGLGLQMRVLQFAPDATDVASAIFSGIFNTGIGAGALIGNQVMQIFDLTDIGFVGATLGALALAIYLITYLKYRRTLPPFSH